MKQLCLFLMAAMTVTYSSAREPTRTSLNNKIGWLHGNCLAIKNANIPPNYQFTLVHLNTNNTIEKAVITKRTTAPEECYPLLGASSNINESAGYFFYSVESTTPVNLAIGILKSNELSVSELNLSYCTTTEGVKFLISKNNSTVWEGYYYLGYESEPTCT